MQFYSMHKGFIFLKDALAIMAMRDSDGGFIPFDIERVTCNLREGTGGRRVTHEKAVLAGAPYGKKNSRREANHFLNGTRNIMIPGKGRPITIQNLLITKFNGETVII
jgi:hypothetical protein